MGAYLYCVVPSGHGPPKGLRGLDRVEVEMLESGSVGAWYAELARPPRATIDHVRTHDRVVRRAISEMITPLPARFGQWFPRPATLAARIGESAAAYGGALSAVAGAAEFGIVIRAVTGSAQAPTAQSPESSMEASPAASEVAASTGRAYLRALAESHDHSRRARERALCVQREVGYAVEHLVRDARPLEVSPRRDDVARVVHLVEGARAADYVATVREFDRPGVRLVLTGPSPPYSFAP